MGGCLRGGRALGFGLSSEGAEIETPKCFDVFVSHHQSIGEDGGMGCGADLNGQFAKWIAEICGGLGLKIFFDKTNLSRVLDEKQFRHDVMASRVVVAVVSSAALADAHGMQQELWWASRAQIPIIPFYNGDLYEPEDYAVLQRNYSFALSRSPVVYRRRTHLRARDCLRNAIYDALMEACGGVLPPGRGDALLKMVERQRRRAQRADRLGSAKDGSASCDLRSAAADEVPPNSQASHVKERSRTLAPTRLGSESVGEQSRDAESKDTHSGRAPASATPPARIAPPTADKRFRFRDEGIEVDESSGVQWLMRSIRDPLGRREQEQRIAALEGATVGSDADAVEEGGHVPRHHTLKPARGILKGARGSALHPATKSSARLNSSGETRKMSPELEQGVARLLEYLLGIGPDDKEQLPTVLQVLKLTLPNAEVATRALSIIFEFVSGVSRCRQIVEQNGSIADIVEAMSVHKEYLDLQTYGCGCLYALSCFRPGSADKDNNAAAIAHAGGIYRVLDAMTSFPGCREVQQWGAGALRHLAIEIGTNRREVSDRGEVQLTMRGINKRVITKVGGIEAIVAAMMKFQDDEDVQENGCAALCNLITSGPESKVRAARAGCIRVAIRAIQTFSDEPELVQFACALLRSLAMGVPENKLGIVAQGGVRQLCVALARHRGDAEVCAQAVAALCNLTSQVSENKVAIVEAGGLELSIAALRANLGASELQQQGCGLLHNLACERSLKSQVIAAGGRDVAEEASSHQDPVVKSLGQMLRRQLAEAGGRIVTGVPTTSNSRTASDMPSHHDHVSSVVNGGDDDVEGLFAPRRAPANGSNGSVRAKALTRPQRKMMANVMESMRKDPQSWLPAEDSEESASAGEKHHRDETGSPRSSVDGGCNSARYGQAADYGVEDLEGLSDTENGPSNDFNSILQRGLARQGPSKFAVSKDAKEFRRGDYGNDSDSDFVVRRQRVEQSSSRANGASAGGLDFVVRRGSQVPKSPRSIASSEESDFVVRRSAAPKLNPEDRERHLEQEPCAKPERTAFSPPSRLAPEPVPAHGNTTEAAQPEPSVDSVDDSDKARMEEVEGVSPASCDAYATASSHASAESAAAKRPSYAPSDAGSDASDGQRWIDFDDEDALERVHRRVRKGQRQERARQSRSRDRQDSDEAFNEPESDGARLLREMLGETDPEPPPPRKAVNMGRSATRENFAKALQRCGEAPPERWDYEWKEAVRLRHETLSQQGWAARAAAASGGTSAAATTVLDGLDGLMRGAGKTLRHRQELAVEGALRRAELAGGVARRIREVGLVQVVQTSRFGRRWAYGLDDDEDSIYGLEDLEELGEAEAALLDAISESQAIEEEEDDEGNTARGNGGDASSPSFGVSTTAARGNGSAQLEALSKRLDQRREERRRVKLL